MKIVGAKTMEMPKRNILIRGIFDTTSGFASDGTKLNTTATGLAEAALFTNQLHGKPLYCKTNLYIMKWIGTTSKKGIIYKGMTHSYFRRRCQQ